MKSWSKVLMQTIVYFILFFLTICTFYVVFLFLCALSLCAVIVFTHRAVIVCTHLPINTNFQCWSNPLDSPIQIKIKTTKQNSNNDTINKYEHFVLKLFIFWFLLIIAFILTWFGLVFANVCSCEFSQYSTFMNIEPLVLTFSQSNAIMRFKIPFVHFDFEIDSRWDFYYFFLNCTLVKQKGQIKNVSIDANVLNLFSIET